jgi:hypothetical protein
VAPVHTALLPLIEPGNGLTSNDVVVRQPVPASVYVIVGVPAVTPVAIPDPTPIVACDVLLLDHVPPLVPSVNAVVEPTHTFVTPAINAGNGLTVTCAEITQPLADVYVMFDVPVVRPVTVPLPAPIVATDVVALFHEPPVSASVSPVVPPPAQTVSVPPIGEGVGYIVTVVVAGAQPVVSV